MSKVTADQVLAVEVSQLGYTEYPAGSNLNKYGKAYGMDGQPWCVMFQWWCFEAAGAADLFCGGHKTAVCSGVMNYAKGIRRWVTKNYRRGDLVIFDFNINGDPDHIGIVETASAATLVTIEGNTSVSSDDNGGAVMRRTRYPYQIMGAYRPAYYGSESSQNASDGGDDQQGGFDVARLKTIKRGSQGTQVRTLQVQLIGRGYACDDAQKASLAQVDGDCGYYTTLAVKRFQKDYGLEVDGICGPLTWAKLLGAGGD